MKAQAKGMGYYNKALEIEPEITEQVKRIAEESGMNVAGLRSRIKGKDAYLEKIRRKYKADGNEYEVKDILRYTYTASARGLVDKTLKSIEQYKNIGYNTIEIKNTWNNELNPYKGINTTIRTDSGQAFELQYCTPENFKLKSGKMHELYEDFRKCNEDSEKVTLYDEMMQLSATLEKP